MRILYFHQYFTTRSGTGGTRSYELARRLVERGHEVTLVTSGRGAQEVLQLRAGEARREQVIDGIRVISLDAGFNGYLAGTAHGGAWRMAQWLEFAGAATDEGRRQPRPDVVYATHTPLTIALPGMRVAAHHGVPFVFEVRDVWPQALVNIGALTNPLVIAWLRALAKSAYAAASHVVALSPGMKEGVVAEGVDPAKVTVIPNASDLDLFHPELDGSEARARLGLGDRFAAIYFGAMGRANGLDYCLDAAKLLLARKEERIVLVLHGAGGTRAALEQRARVEGLTNVVFSDPVPDKAEVARIVAGCDAAMTIYLATNETSWSPNKMFDALAAGRPVLVNAGGWLGETIERNEAGFFVDPTRPEALADALVRLAGDRALTKRLGSNARALAEREFGRDAMVGRLERVLQDAVANEGGRHVE